MDAGRATATEGPEEGKLRLENAIPFTKSDVVEHLAGRFGDAAEGNRFRALCALVESIYHLRFHENLEDWKLSYAPFDPDRGEGLIPGVSPLPSPEAERSALDGLRKVLVAANYREIDGARIKEAFGRTSPWGLEIEVDLGRYRTLGLFYRGEHPESLIKEALLLKKKFDYSVFRQVVLVFGLKEEAKGRKGRGKKGKGRYRSDRLYIKLFKNVPTVDLEMLFPEAEIRVRTVDKLKVVLPLAAGAGSSLYKIIGYVLGSGQIQYLWHQVGFWALVGGFFGVALKGFSSYKNTVEKYLKALTESLYFQNLDNNSGVFKYLLDDAEEEECKELILGWYFLHFGGGGITEAELDARVEAYFHDELGSELDFEVDDALRKLVDLGLVSVEDGRLSALPQAAAIDALKRRWAAEAKL